MSVSGPFPSGGKETEMSKEHENKEGNFKNKEEKRRPWDWCRIYNVDFMKAEDSDGAQAMGKFGREIKEKLAAAPSPFDELVFREEEDDREREACRIDGLRSRLHELAAKADLTARQRECFRLLCVERSGINGAALEMGISPQRVRELFEIVGEKLKKLLEEEKIQEKIEAFLEANKSSLNALDREILVLRFVRNMDLREIAARVNRDVSRVSRRLERMFRLIRRK